MEEARSKSLRGRPDLKETHIFDLLDSKICIRWDSDGLRSDVNDNHHWSCDKSLEKIANFLV